MSETNEPKTKKPEVAADATKPAKAVKPPKRGESPKEIAKLLSQIEKAEKSVQVAEVELTNRKEEAKAAKGEWMLRVADLRELVRTRERWAEEAKRQPLLNQVKKSKGKDAGAIVDSEWRKLGIDKLGGSVTPKDRESLGAKGLYTLGDVQDLMTKQGTWWFQEVKGVGRAAADRIEDEFNKIVMANTPDEATTPKVEPAPQPAGA